MVRNIVILKFVLVICVVLSNAENLYASTLIFKTTKEVTSTDLIDLGIFDTSKYGQIRVTIKQANKLIDSPPLTKAIAEIDLNLAQREVKRLKELLPKGVISRLEYDNAEYKLEIAQANYDNAVETVYPPISIYGIEGTEEILIATFDGKSIINTIVIDTPPTKISVRVFGRNTYKLFAWGSL